MLGSACNPQEPDCSPGLVCVPQDPLYDEVENVYNYYTGICQTACNPCDDQTCAEDESCFAFEGQGGFCSTELLGRGELCMGAHRGICGPHLSCMSTGCMSYCIPENSMTSSLYLGNTASPSSDCGLGEVCSPMRLSIYGELYTCLIGELAELGEPCGDANTFCASPYVCKLKKIDNDYERYVCSISESCEQDADCGDDTIGCYDGYCIKDESLSYGYTCYDDANCESWLACEDGFCVATDK